MSMLRIADATRIFTGTKVFHMTSGNSAALLFTDSEYESLFGCTNEWIRCSCRLFRPVNAGSAYVWDSCHFVLQAQAILSGHVYQRWVNWTISQTSSGAKFTPEHWMETDFGDSGCTTYGGSGIQIVRISGWA